MIATTLRRSAIAIPALVLVLAGCGSETSDTTASEPAADAAAEADSPSPETPSTPAKSPGKDSAATAPAILNFSAETVGGDSFVGADLAGKPSVLWFWAPWCPTCRGQIEGVSSLAEEYGDRVNFVGVGSLDEVSAIGDFAADVPADMPHLVDPEGAVWRHFGIVEQSVYVVLDADSKVVSEGYLDDDALADMVADVAG